MPFVTVNVRFIYARVGKAHVPVGFNVRHYIISVYLTIFDKMLKSVLYVESLLGPSLIEIRARSLSLKDEIITLTEFWL